MRLKNVEKILNASFAKCHMSCIVNEAMIVSINPKGMKLYLENGQSVDIGRRHLKKFLSKHKQKTSSTPKCVVDKKT